jgi:hypothetical protein
MYCIIILIVWVEVVEKESIGEQRRTKIVELYEQIVVAIETMYRSTWINIRML